MIKELHGKHYYVELDNYQLVIEAQRMISEDPILKDEFFVMTKNNQGTWIIYSEAKCGSFIGKKYSAWEKFKRDIYKLK